MENWREIVLGEAEMTMALGILDSRTLDIIQMALTGGNTIYFGPV